jgi:hypothetical protein
MKQVNLWFRCVLAGILISMLAASELHGCVRSLTDVKVPPSFAISVMHLREPVAGIHVAVYDMNDPRAEAAHPLILRLVTAKDGRVEIKDLPEGRYIIGTEGPGQGSAVDAIVSARHEQLKTDILLEWPYSRQATLKVRSLAGELASNDPWKPFQDVHLELWAAGLENPLAKEVTGPNGRFHFDVTRPGVYVLRVIGRQDGINPDRQIGGEFAIELDPSAPDALPSLFLRLAMSTCGLEYSSCPAADKTIVTGSRHIKVVYEPGMSEYPEIRDARYKLLDYRGASIAEGTTDRNGIAELPFEIVGHSTLIVAADSLLTSIQQPLDLLPPDESAPNLVVTMTSIGGSEACSTVRLENHATPQ